MEDAPIAFRERQGLLFRGFRFSDEFIGKKFNRSASTIKADRERIFKRLGTDCLAWALLICIATGEISVADIKCVYYSSLHA